MSVSRRINQVGSETFLEMTVEDGRLIARIEEPESGNYARIVLYSGQLLQLRQILYTCFRSLRGTRR